MVSVSVHEFERLLTAFKQIHVGETQQPQGDTEAWTSLLAGLRAVQDEQRRRDKASPRIHLLDAAGRGRDERSYAEFLRWMLDPRASHEQGPLFLNQCLRWMRLSTEDSDKAEVRSEISGEESRVDVAVRIPGRIALFIECKIDTPEGLDQTPREGRDLKRWAQAGKISAEGQRSLFVTRTGEPATDSGFANASWAELAEQFDSVFDHVKAEPARTLLGHVIHCFRSLTQGGSMSNKESEQFVLSNWKDVDALVEVRNDLESRMYEEVTEQKFRKSLDDAGFGPWQQGIEKKQRNLFIRHPEFFIGPGNFWTCFELDDLDLGHLLSSDAQRRPWIGIWWEPLRKAVGADILVDARRKLADAAQRSNLPRRLEQRDANRPIGRYVDWKFGKVEDFAQLPTLITEEFKLLLPFVDEIVALSKKAQLP